MPVSGDSAADILERARARAEALRNPGVHMPAGELPAGFALNGLTIQRNGKGEVVQSWQKQRPETPTHEHMLQAFELALHDRPLPVAKPVPAPVGLEKDLLCVYPMGDPHLGLHTWAPEVGEDFDLRIASRNLRTAMATLSSVSPPAEEALIVNLGDYFHADNKRGMTERSGNVLDMDTRLPKVIAVGIDTMVACIELALQRHLRVRAIMVPGNHDDLSAFWLSMCLHHHFRDEPRVSIDTSPAKHHYYRFRKCLIGAAHGDTEKPKDLPGMMACDRARDWGETMHRAWLLGHVHHQNVHEFPGCTTESFNTLAPGDAHARSHPQYRARRCMIGDVWHAEHGPVARNQIGIQAIEAAA